MQGRRSLVRRVTLQRRPHRLSDPSGRFTQQAESVKSDAPAAPNVRATMISFKPAMASSVDWGMSTPLPDASPLAFSTTLWPHVLMYSIAWSTCDGVNTRKAAVGMECRVMKAFENAFDPSIRAARAVGPNTGIPTIAYTECKP